MSRFKKAFSLGFRTSLRLRLTVACASYLVGLLILLISPIAGNRDYIPISIFTAGLGQIVFTLFFTVTSYCDSYPELVRLGTTRRGSLLAVTLNILAFPFAFTVAATLVSLLECVIFTELFGMSGSISVPVIFLPGGLALILGAWVLGVLAAWCIRRFGQNGMVAIYFVYMLLLVFLPRILSMLAEKYAIIGRIAEILSANVVLALISVAVIALIGAALLLRGLYKSSI